MLSRVPETIQLRHYRAFTAWFSISLLWSLITICTDNSSHSLWLTWCAHCSFQTTLLLLIFEEMFQSLQMPCHLNNIIYSPNTIKLLVHWADHTQLSFQLEIKCYKVLRLQMILQKGRYSSYLSLCLLFASCMSRWVEISFSFGYRKWDLRKRKSDRENKHNFQFLFLSNEILCSRFCVVFSIKDL